VGFTPPIPPKKVQYNGTTVAEYTYDELSRRTLVTLGNDSNAVYEYDIANKLSKLTSNIDDGNSITFEYGSYDHVGNRKSCKIDDANAHVYQYDNLYQLTFVDYNDGNSTGYAYDPLGSRTDVNASGTITDYDTNCLNQYTSVGDTNYSYDKNGNLADINNGQFQYVYDCENRLIEAKENSVTVATYAYDFAGRRVSKTTGGVTTRYVYDGDQIVAEYQGGVPIRKFVYGPGIDEPILMINVSGETETLYYYHFDGLGSVVALSDNDGDIIERYSYDVFGEPNRMSNIGNPYLFTAREYDSETGNYYYRARYYKPLIGRFLQTDPIGYNDGLNMYMYVGDNPGNLVDPWGLVKVGYYLPASKRNLELSCFERAAESYSDYAYPIDKQTAGDVIYNSIQELEAEGKNVENVAIYGHGEDIVKALDNISESKAAAIGNLLSENVRIDLQGCFLGTYAYDSERQDYADKFGQPIRTYTGYISYGTLPRYFQEPIRYKHGVNKDDKSIQFFVFAYPAKPEILLPSITNWVDLLLDAIKDSKK
jgi:RHS repeat-associated protein